MGGCTQLMHRSPSPHHAFIGCAIDAAGSGQAHQGADTGFCVLGCKHGVSFVLYLYILANLISVRQITRDRSTLPPWRNWQTHRV